MISSIRVYVCLNQSVMLCQCCTVL